MAIIISDHDSGRRMSVGCNPVVQNLGPEVLGHTMEGLMQILGVSCEERSRRTKAEFFASGALNTEIQQR
jgi:hypothetical protein